MTENVYLDGKSAAYTDLIWLDNFEIQHKS